jgi:hypothetical protein
MKVNQPVFSLWIVVTIVLRDPFESLHPVPKHVFRGWSLRTAKLVNVRTRDLVGEVTIDWAVLLRVRNGA